MITKRKVGLGIVSTLALSLIIFVLAPKQKFIEVKTDETTPKESNNFFLPPGNHYADENKIVNTSEEMTDFFPCDDNSLDEQKVPTFEEMTLEEQLQLLEALPEGATLVDSNLNPIDTSLIELIFFGKTSW